MSYSIEQMIIRKIGNIWHWLSNLVKWIIMLPLILALYFWVAIIPCVGTSILYRLFDDWNGRWSH